MPTDPRPRKSNALDVFALQLRRNVAHILSVIESCRRLKIPVRDYLADILPGLANAPRQRVADLTPATWAARTSSMRLV